jgi:uncharacterized membrane protein
VDQAINLEKNMYMSIETPKNTAVDRPAVHQNSLLESIEQLPVQVIKNVEAIAQHQDQTQQNATAHQRGLDKITAVFGQPQFLYFQIVFFTIWGVCSYLASRHLWLHSFPAFHLSDQGLGAAGLLISTGVLIYQTRQEKLSEERSQLMLQLNLLTEQKIAKLISLVEELRVDLPNVQNRDDLEAEVMKKATDPQVILEVLQQNLDSSPSSLPGDQI